MKTTRATIKKFIKECFEKDSLFIKKESSFSGMTDCVEYSNDKSIIKATRDIKREEYTLGVFGAWFVGRGDDHFTKCEDDQYVGYHIYNCCGSFTLLTAK